MRRFLRYLGIAIVVLGALLPAQAAGPFLVGNWYGEGQPDSPNVFWLAHIQPDGTFTALFRFCRGRKGSDLSEKGTWTYADKTATLVTLVVNGAPAVPPQVERYHTLSYDGRKHVYRHERTGFAFTAVRVDADFDLPPCSLSS